MRQAHRKTAKAATPQDKLLPRLSLLFFKHSWLTALLWVVVFSFGILSYTTLLKRSGFPSVNIPIVVVSGSYAVNDASKVDMALAKPVLDIALKQPGASMAQSNSDNNFFSATIQYNESVDVAAAKKNLEQQIAASGVVPKSANLTYVAPYFGATGGSAEKIDATISLYSRDDALTPQQLVEHAKTAVAYLNKQDLSQVETFFVQNPFDTAVNPATGRAVSVQRSFDRYGERHDGKTVFSNSIIIGVSSIKDADVIKLDDQIHAVLKDLERQPQFSNVQTAVSASFAPSIQQEISELQRVLLEGLIAVLVVGSIVIALRASFITVISMVTVIATAIGLLYLIGYTLNVITLFALILGLSLIVDDTIIMVEAIDAARRKHHRARAVIQEATRKISRAMVAATFTAVFSFAPLLFVSGILGSFIRAIPVTIISALLISLLVALIFIPLFARFILLGKKQLGEEGVTEIAANFEHTIALAISRPMLWSRHSRRKQLVVGLAALTISVVFISAALFTFTKVTFNIFPNSKDSNQIALSMIFPSGTTITQAEADADAATARAKAIIGDNFKDASYYGTANARNATLVVDLTPYGERDITAPQLVTELNKSFEHFGTARVSSYQIDIGPPTQPFIIDINATDRVKAERLAADMAKFLEGTKLTRPSGKVATIKNALVSNTSVYERSDGKPIISVSATFDGTDTSTLTVLAQQAVDKHYTGDVLQGRFGLDKDAVTFNLGQESENQDSFKSLALAFPILLVAIYILLLVQFRSFLQPLLIFMAIPFSLFGVALGLYLTNNPISFFSMLGFFALIGLSIKNTILLTDYANQARRAGAGAIDASVAALGARFRPLVATSLTAVVSLIPLAITSPFWEGLAVTLIFGLLSSTLLVILVFPYYYLGGEFIRAKVRLPRRRT